MKRRTIKIGEREFSGPSSWSEQALYICGSKYARIIGGYWEKSVEEIILRIATKIFSHSYEQHEFELLVDVLIKQEAAFNSPVWFNLGVEAEPQTSACFILKVEDSLEAIIDWWRTQARIFDNGSGMGADLSKIREKGASIRNGLGVSSGPQSWAKVSDAIGASVKSGGITRRAATLLSLADWHPDIEEFIKTKATTEEIIQVLEKEGYNLSSQNSSTYDIIYHQQANRSVRLSDPFMFAASSMNDEEYNWDLFSPLTNSVVKSTTASNILDSIAKSIYVCGDPGIMFSDTINDYHTAPSGGKINSANPCGEYLFLDNSSCNLASINLIKFYDPKSGEFNYPHLKEVVELLIEAQNIIIDFSSYPTEEIRINTQRYRPLGLGITNLGGLLMVMGIPYDSDEARLFAASIMGLITSWGWIKSANIAERIGDVYTNQNELDKKTTYNILDALSTSLFALASFVEEQTENKILTNLLVESSTILQLLAKEEFPINNAQISAIAPTGTISLIMDCASTGCEPVYSLSYTKELAQEGKKLKISLPIIAPALLNLEYSKEDIKKIEFYVKRGKKVENLIKEEHRPIFATALEINPEAHLKMVASLQRFVSGGISKTINLPKEITSDQIKDYIIKAWRMGIKGITFYRDGSKAAQPLLLQQEERVDEFVCWQCYSSMIQTGTCWICPNCGEGGICG